jgi:hypothetical protein
MLEGGVDRRVGEVRHEVRERRVPVVPVEFEKAGLALSYFSTVTTLGTPQDAMLQEIRIESFFPADEATAAHAWPP